MACLPYDHVMARPLRIQYEGALYHVTCRGNERKAIFKDDQDKNVFLELLNDGLNTYNIILYCYVIMDNHFHLLLETPLVRFAIKLNFRISFIVVFIMDQS